jgi:CMP-N-acetylneuraminic acid synthetase
MKKLVLEEIYLQEKDIQNAFKHFHKKKRDYIIVHCPMKFITDVSSLTVPMDIPFDYKDKILEGRTLYYHQKQDVYYETTETTEKLGDKSCIWSYLYINK